MKKNAVDGKQDCILEFLFSRCLMFIYLLVRTRLNIGFDNDNDKQNANKLKLPDEYMIIHAFWNKMLCIQYDLALNKDESHQHTPHESHPVPRQSTHYPQTLARAELKWDKLKGKAFRILPPRVLLRGSHAPLKGRGKGNGNWKGKGIKTMKPSGKGKGTKHAAPEDDEDYDEDNKDQNEELETPQHEHDQHIQVSKLSMGLKYWTSFDGIF
ncbi:hypothetical protein D9758_001426 [Tetrapyrgos nigripes]|uniref:Uncharacterized protein n=1 Tax=Tetrapyrgos nigripes TaxID=182062 RepID=A0A8H5GSS7_9AGAR|nr:hypothetical protein D9758_001426 [Tetrapyrgos nigripes]